ncbi:MAG: hypothetical protein ACI4L9_04150 [Candidatus Coproplasma sp.]
MLWILILVVALAFFVVMHAIILPKIFLRVRFDIKSPIGRGVKVTQDADGRKILYRADANFSKFLNGYVISEIDERKQVVCKVDDNLKYIDYDAVVFDNSNRVCKVMNVKELITEQGYTKPVELPENTAYALIYLNQADGRKFKNDFIRRMHGWWWLLYLLAGVPVDILSVFTIRLCLAKCFGGLFGEIFLTSASSNIIAAIVCAAIFVLNAIVSMLVIKSRYGKKGDKE